MVFWVGKIFWSLKYIISCYVKIYLNFHIWKGEKNVLDVAKEHLYATSFQHDEEI